MVNHIAGDYAVQGKAINISQVPLKRPKENSPAGITQLTQGSGMTWFFTIQIHSHYFYNMKHKHHCIHENSAYLPNLLIAYSVRQS